MNTHSILYGNEYMTLYPDGSVSRPAIKMAASGSWKITGAVTRNNFGHVTRHYTLADILANPSGIPWRFKNGKQKTFVTDLDHGAHREWRCPTHSIS
jgi:hypothetical protein